MTQGETKTVTLEPEEAYGPVDEDDVVTFSREKLETGGDGLEVGELVRSERGDTGWVTDVSDEGVTVDFNHELAGERVEFEIRLLEVHATKTGKGPA
jgi:FKBP-type peptidyl-prolyl cis-trans isomerase SlyD